VADMDMPGFRLHSLKGEFEGFFGGNGTCKLAGGVPLCCPRRL
jgi:hypothetical protein